MQSKSGKTITKKQIPSGRPTKFYTITINSRDLACEGESITIESAGHGSIRIPASQWEELKLAIDDAVADQK